MKANNLVGRRFGRLTVMGRHGTSCPVRWDVLCDCGTTKHIVGSSLLNGTTRSCGCLSREVTKLVATKHGHSAGGRRSSTYMAWASMLERCSNPNNVRYPRYGGRGIRVCKRWSSFESFLSDMGEKPRGHQIDRRDNDGNYTPANCRWVTRTQNARNKCNVKKYKIGGDLLTIPEISERTGIHETTLHARLKAGWHPHRAVSEPTANRGQKGR